MIRTAERLEQLERTLDLLVEMNETMPAIVEGKRDVAALRRLGLPGELFTINHGGGTLVALCDRLAEQYDQVLLLVDWDRTGGQIMRVMTDNLKGRVRTHRELRKNLAIYAEVRDVESLPSYLATLRKKVGTVTRSGDRTGASFGG